MSGTERNVNHAADAILARRPYSAQGLMDKLTEKGYPEEQAQAAVCRLLEYGYLNDKEYAKNLAASLTRRGYGTRRIRQTLLQKGIERELADEVCEDQDDASESVDGLLRKLGKGRALDNKERARLSSALFRRGFDSDEIRAGLERYRDQLTYQEDDE